MLAELNAVMLKEIRQITRDKRMIMMLFIAPIIQLLLFGYAVNFDINKIYVAFCMQDSGRAAINFKQQLLADGLFQEAKTFCTGEFKNFEKESLTNFETVLSTGKAQVAVTIPSNFSKNLSRGENVTVLTQIDGSDSVIARYASNAINAFTQSFSKPYLLQKKELLQDSTNISPTIPQLAIKTRLFFNPEMKSSFFIVPGVSAMILLVVTMLATSMGLARERELGVLEQVMVTPIAVPVLLLGKILPFIAIGLFDVLTALVLSLYVFDLPFQGEGWLYTLGTFLFILSTVGLGLFISTISKNQQQAFLSGFLILMPAMLLSGIMTPIATMPGWLKLITYVNPIRYFVEILRGVLLKGAGLHDLWVQFLALALFGSIIITLASLRFKKTTG